MSKKFKLRTVFDRCLLKSHIAHWAALRFLDSDTRTLKRSHESSEPPTHDPNFVRLEFLNFTQFSSSRPHRRRRATENLEKISIHIVTRWRNSRIMIISECYDHRLTNSPLEAFHEHFSLLRCELWRKKISRRSGGKAKNYKIILWINRGMFFRVARSDVLPACWLHRSGAAQPKQSRVAPTWSSHNRHGAIRPLW